MKASEKELKCIAIARKYRNLAIKRHEDNGSTDLEEVHAHYATDDDVSEIKTFSQLWKDKGLMQFGIQLYGYRKQEQLDCLVDWFEILFEDTEVLKMLLRTVETRLTELQREFYKNHPEGHINISSSVDLLPTEIDKHFESYEVL